MGLLTVLKAKAREMMIPLIYRYPPTGLQPDRLGVYLSEIMARASSKAAVAEIGCSLGGTTVLAFKALRRSGWKGEYICYDTFGGFVPEQFDADVKIGSPRRIGTMFQESSQQLVRKILNYHGCLEVQLVQGDITKVAKADLRDKYMAVLLDIDLSEPTYDALKIFWPRMEKGGIILVDDCPADSVWKARVGYARFCKEMKLKEVYRSGLGVLVKA